MTVASSFLGLSFGALVQKYLDGARAAARRYLLENDPDHPGFYQVRDVPVFSTNRRGAGDTEGFDEPYLDRILHHHANVLEATGHFVPIFEEHHPDDRFDASRPKVGDLRNLTKRPIQVADPETHELVTLPTIHGDFRRIKPEYALRMLQGDLEHRSIEIVPGNPRISGCSLSSTVPPYFKYPNLVVELGEGVELPAVKTLQLREKVPTSKDAPVLVCFAERFSVQAAPGVEVKVAKFYEPGQVVELPYAVDPGGRRIQGPIYAELVRRVESPPGAWLVSVRRTDGTGDVFGDIAEEARIVRVVQMSARQPAQRFVAPTPVRPHPAMLQDALMNSDWHAVAAYQRAAGIEPGAGYAGRMSEDERLFGASMTREQAASYLTQRYPDESWWQLYREDRPVPTAPRTDRRPPRPAPPRRFAASEVEMIDQATGEVLWSGAFAKLLEDNAGDVELEAAVAQLRAGTLAEVVVGGGPRPATIVRKPRVAETAAPAVVAARERGGVAQRYAQIAKKRQAFGEYFDAGRSFAMDMLLDGATTEEIIGSLRVPGDPEFYAMMGLPHRMPTASEMAELVSGGYAGLSLAPRYHAGQLARRFEEEAKPADGAAKPADDPVLAAVNALSAKMDALLDALTEEVDEEEAEEVDETADDTATGADAAKPGEGEGEGAAAKPPGKKDEGNPVQASETRDQRALRMRDATEIEKLRAENEKLRSEQGAAAAKLRLDGCVAQLQVGRYVFREPAVRQLLADYAHDEKVLAEKFAALKSGLKRAPSAQPLPTEPDGSENPLLRVYAGDPETLDLARNLLDGYFREPGVQRMHPDPADFLKYAIRSHARQAANGSHR